MRKLLLLCIGIAVMQCSDVIVPNISEDLVLLQAPQDESQVVGNSVTLSWEALPDAIDYRVEVAMPGFANIQQLVLDSFTAALSLNLTFAPGDYEWRVTALNEAYASACCEEWRFQMLSDEDADLSTLSIILLSPASNTVSNEASINCSWQALDAASVYRFQLSSQADFSSLFLDTLITESTYSLSDLQEQTYYWRVRGESDLSNTFTSYSTRQFTIDQTAPQAPVLVFPEDEAILDFSNQSEDFRWTSSSESQVDTIYVYNDVFLDQLLWQQASTIQSIDVDTMGLNLGAGEYYWNVRSVDAGTNTSPESESRKFVVE
ncbi:MAG: hypothetical protein AAFP77_18335 [Bacteroidota bacterium]